MNDENITSSQITLGILFLVLIIGGYIGSDLFLEWKKSKQVEPEKTEVEVAEIIKETVEIKTPEKESFDGKGGATNGYLEKIIVDLPYTPSGDIYSNNLIYEKTVPEVAIIGDFEVAALMIKGTIDNDLMNFISINVGEFSGTYGIERLNKDMLNINSLKYSDAILTKKSCNKDGEFEIVIDLKSPIIISTTKEDYLKGGGKSKEVVLWDYIKPQPDEKSASIARIYALIYDRFGNYGNNVRINELKLNYACAVDSNCDVKICDKDDVPGSVCLSEKFKKDGVELNYIDYYSK